MNRAYQDPKQLSSWRKFLVCASGTLSPPLYRTVCRTSYRELATQSIWMIYHRSIHDIELIWHQMNPPFALYGYWVSFCKHRTDPGATFLRKKVLRAFYVPAWTGEKAEQVSQAQSKTWSGFAEINRATAQGQWSGRQIFILVYQRPSIIHSR